VHLPCEEKNRISGLVPAPIHAYDCLTLAEQVQHAEMNNSDCSRNIKIVKRRTKHRLRFYKSSAPSELRVNVCPTSPSLRNEGALGSIGMYFRITFLRLPTVYGLSTKKCSSKSCFYYIFLKNINN